MDNIIDIKTILAQKKLVKKREEKQKKKEVYVCPACHGYEWFASVVGNIQCAKCGHISKNLSITKK